jgi:Dihydrodipicolinate synthetase family
VSRGRGGPGVHLLVEAGVPVVVGTGAQNPRLAAAHAAHARKVGAVGLMVIPRLLSRGSAAAAQKVHFEEVLSAGGDLPAVIYNSPYYGFQTRADLFASLRRSHKNLVALSSSKMPANVVAEVPLTGLSLRGVLANHFLTAETPNIAAQRHPFSRRIVVGVPLTGLSFLSGSLTRPPSFPVPKPTPWRRNPKTPSSIPRP